MWYFADSLCKAGHRHVVGMCGGWWKLGIGPTVGWDLGPLVLVSSRGLGEPQGPPDNLTSEAAAGFLSGQSEILTVS